MLFGRQSKNINFIKKYSSKKISEKEAEELKELTKKMLRLRQLVFSRWAQVMRNFEKLMYENPEQNLNKLWWDLVKKYQIIDFSRDKPDWASKIHLVSAPVYYHNYLLGELLASQLHNYICESVLKQDANNADYSDKRIGKYLKESIFSLGRRCHWSELIKRATGESLNPKYFAEQFC
jgi:peptidyl-dipeptidase A